MDAPYGEGDMRTGFAPTSCPAFNFDYNPEDHTAGGTIVMSKLSLNTAFDDLGYVQMSKLGPRYFKWSIGPVCAFEL